MIIYEFTTQSVAGFYLVLFGASYNTYLTFMIIMRSTPLADKVYEDEANTGDFYRTRGGKILLTCRILGHTAYAIILICSFNFWERRMIGCQHHLVYPMQFLVLGAVSLCFNLCEIYLYTKSYYKDFHQLE